MPRSRSRRGGKRKRKSSTRARGGGRRDEWIGGRLLPPFFVDDPEEEPFRPELVVWMDSQGLIVGHALPAPGETEGILARTLIEAMERPLIGPRRRPSAIRVPDRSSAAEVRAAVGNRIPVRIAPTPELDEVLESMAESFPAPPAGKGRHPSYFENGRIPEETVAELFAAARLFHETAPWEVVSDDQVLALDIPDFDVDGACLSIIGNLGESFGAIVFPSFGHYMVFVGLADSEPRDEGGLRDFGTSGLSLNFVTGAELPVSMRREVASHAWPVAATDAYPHVARFDRDGTPFPTRPRDLRIAAAAAEAFCRFFAAHRDLFTGERVAAGPVSESYSVLDGIEVRLSALTGPWSLARGEGADSGHASISAPEDAAYPVHVLDRALVTELETFAFTQFGNAWLNYLDDFEDPTEVAQLASPWSVFHFRPKQETVLEAFLRFAPRPLSPEERSWLEAQRAAWLSVWEVDAVDPGVSLTLRDLLSGEERFVHESEGSKTLVLRDAVLGRVVDHEKGSFVCGLHPNPLPPWDAAEVVRRARGRLRRRRQVPVDRLRDEAFGRYLIRRWEEAVDWLDERTSVPPDLRNTDGDVLLLTTDHFRLERAAVGEVAAGLAAMEGVEPAAGSDEGEGEGAPAYVFFRTGDGQPEDQQRTVVGFGWLTDKALRVQTNSRERADALRARIEAACGDGIRHRAREHADPTSEAAPFPSPDSTPAPPVPDALVQEIKRQHYADWADHPLPALDGMTAREAVRTADGRAAVDNLLKQMENQEQRSPGAAFDFTDLRRELELE